MKDSDCRNNGTERSFVFSEKEHKEELRAKFRAIVNIHYK
jgi:hypothetical protein